MKDELSQEEKDVIFNIYLKKWDYISERNHSANRERVQYFIEKEWKKRGFNKPKVLWYNSRVLMYFHAEEAFNYYHRNKSDIDNGLIDFNSELIKITNSIPFKYRTPDDYYIKKHALNINDHKSIFSLVEYAQDFFDFTCNDLSNNLLEILKEVNEIIPFDKHVFIYEKAGE